MTERDERILVMLLTALGGKWYRVGMAYGSQETTDKWDEQEVFLVRAAAGMLDSFNPEWAGGKAVITNIFCCSVI